MESHVAPSSLAKALPPLDVLCNSRALGGIKDSTASTTIKKEKETETETEIDTKKEGGRGEGEGEGGEGGRRLLKRKRIGFGLDFVAAMHILRPVMRASMALENYGQVRQGKGKGKGKGKGRGRGRGGNKAETRMAAVRALARQALVDSKKAKDSSSKDEENGEQKGEKMMTKIKKNDDHENHILAQWDPRNPSFCSSLGRVTQLMGSEVFSFASLDDRYSVAEEKKYISFSDGGAVWSLLPPSFFLLFWALSLFDLSTPSKRYDSTITTLRERRKTLTRHLPGQSVTGAALSASGAVRRAGRLAGQLEMTMEHLAEEEETQRENERRVKKIMQEVIMKMGLGSSSSSSSSSISLSLHAGAAGAGAGAEGGGGTKEAKKTRGDDREGKRVAVALLRTCVLPRTTFSPQDSLYTAYFLSRVIRWGVPGFSVVHWFQVSTRT